jgi:CDP-diglyceride synthetase
MNRETLKKRVGFGSLMLVVLAGFLWWDASLTGAARGWPIKIALAALILQAFSEYATWVRQTGGQLLTLSGGISILLCIFFPQYAVALLLGLPLVFAHQMLRKQTEGALQRIGMTMLGVVWLGGGAMMMLQLRMISMPLFITFLLAVKGTDIGAFFTGSAIGKNKMIPWLSPGKSWEGLGGGVATALLVGIVSALITNGWEWSVIWRMGVFGMVVGLAGQFGDLCESLLKRSVGTKDSASLVPEFGGVLDILDSPLIAASIGMIVIGWLF